MAEMQIEGLDELLAKLNALPDKAESAFRVALDEGADKILDEMKSTTSFNDVTGNLRKSLEKTSVKGIGLDKYIDVGPNYNKKGNHAHLVEFGTTKMKARPFIEPAHLKTRQENKELIKKRLKEALDL
jgi:HK97 gp10 family phage protein